METSEVVGEKRKRSISNSMTQQQPQRQPAPPQPSQSELYSLMRCPVLDSSQSKRALALLFISIWMAVLLLTRNAGPSFPTSLFSDQEDNMLPVL